MDWLDKKADQTELLVKEILAIATTDDDDSVSAQAALHLLRHTAVPRASFLLRCLPPLQTLDFAERHDTAVMRTFSALLGADDPLGADSATWTEREWDAAAAQHGPSVTAGELKAKLELARAQVQLPLRWGGLGLQSAVDTAPLAHLASWADFLRLQDQLHLGQPFADLEIATSIATSDNVTLAAVREAWGQAANALCEPLADGSTRLGEILAAEHIDQLGDAQRGARQVDLEHAAAKTRFDRLRASVGEHTPDGTRLLACSAFGASGFLRALPFTKELQLPNPVLLCAIRHRLHLPIPLIAHGPRRCTHNDAVYDVDPYGEHDHVCPRSGRIKRHNTMQAQIMALMRIAGIRCEKCDNRTLQLSSDDQGHEHPDLLAFYPDTLAPDLIDACIAHPLASGYQKNYSHTGAAADERGKAKVAPNLYVNKARELGMSVSAFNAETYGGMGEQARETLKHITKTAVSIGTRGQGGWAASHIAELGRQLIGVGIARGIYEQFSIGYGKRCADEFLRPPCSSLRPEHRCRTHASRSSSNSAWERQLGTLNES